MEGIKSLYYSTKSDMFRNTKFICSRHKPKYLHNVTLKSESKPLNVNILLSKSTLNILVNVILILQFIVVANKINVQPKI